MTPRIPKGWRRVRKGDFRREGDRELFHDLHSGREFYEKVGSDTYARAVLASEFVIRRARKVRKPRKVAPRPCRRG